MNAITDMPSVVSGAKRIFSAMTIRVRLLKNISGKSGVALNIRVPGKHMGNREGYLHILKQETLPVFLLIYYLFHIIRQINF